jgi:hypothetical protein
VAPVIREEPKISQEKTRIMIECKVRAASAPKVHWLKEHMIVKEDTRHRVKITEVTKGQWLVVLEINKPSEENKGSYKLVAKNEKGETASQTIQVNVDGNSFPTMFSTLFAS